MENLERIKGTFIYEKLIDLLDDDINIHTTYEFYIDDPDDPNYYNFIVRQNNKYKVENHQDIILDFLFWCTKKFNKVIGLIENILNGKESSLVIIEKFLKLRFYEYIINYHTIDIKEYLTILLDFMPGKKFHDIYKFEKKIKNILEDIENRIILNTSLNYIENNSDFLDFISYCIENNENYVHKLQKIKELCKIDNITMEKIFVILTDHLSNEVLKYKFLPFSSNNLELNVNYNYEIIFTNKNIWDFKRINFN